MKKRVFIIIFIALLALIIYIFYNNNSKKDYSFFIETVPSDAIAYINDKKVKNGKNYSDIDKISLTFKREGFADYKREVKLYNNEENYIGVIMEPSSDDYSNWYQNQDQYNLSSKISSKSADEYTKYKHIEYPILSILPYQEVSGPFRIDYGFTSEGALFLEVSNSSPKGRQRAIDWIKSQGYNPAEYDIIYKDFVPSIVLKETEDAWDD